jgi:hypothetical protein
MAQVYHLVAVVRDVHSAVLSSTARITVHVTDANDHDPIWLVPTDVNSTVNVFVRTPIGTVVKQVRAGDDDVGDNARLSYSLHRFDTDEGDQTLPFEVDPGTGSVVVSEDLVQFVRLRDNVTFSAFLLATDHGTPSRQTAEFRRLTFVVTRRPIEGSTWPLSSASSPGFLGRHGNGRGGGVAAYIGDGAFVAAAVATGTGLVLLIVTLGAVWCVVRRRRKRSSNDESKSAIAANRKHNSEVCKYNCRIETLKAITLKESQKKKLQQQQEERLLRNSSTDGVTCSGRPMSRCGATDNVKAKPDILDCFADSFATTTTDSNLATSLSCVPTDHSDVDECYITKRPAAPCHFTALTTANELQVEFNTFPSHNNIHCRTVSNTIVRLFIRKFLVTLHERGSTL